MFTVLAKFSLKMCFFHVEIATNLTDYDALYNDPYGIREFSFAVAR